MNIKILARLGTSYSVKRLIYEAGQRGYGITVDDPLDYKIVLNKNKAELFIGKRKVSGIDVVLPRLGASSPSYALAVVNQFEMMGVPAINPAMSLFRSRDKLKCLQYMTTRNIDIPRTVVIRKPSDIKEAVKNIGGFPVVLKLLSGTQGMGIMLAENFRAMESALDTLWSLGQDIILQECIKESLGKDIRAFVVGQRVVAAIRREAKIGEFRSNLHRGGRGKKIRLKRSFERAAIEAARVVGLNVAGVDMLETADGPKVMEVNSSPGIEGIESVTGLNVAGQVIDFAATMVKPVRKLKARASGLRL